MGQLAVFAVQGTIARAVLLQRWRALLAATVLIKEMLKLMVRATLVTTVKKVRLVQLQRLVVVRLVRTAKKDRPIRNRALLVTSPTQLASRTQARFRNMQTAARYALPASTAHRLASLNQLVRVLLVTCARLGSPAILLLLTCVQLATSVQKGPHQQLHAMLARSRLPVARTIARIARQVATVCIATVSRQSNARRDTTAQQRRRPSSQTLAQKELTIQTLANAMRVLAFRVQQASIAVNKGCQHLRAIATLVTTVQAARPRHRKRTAQSATTAATERATRPHARQERFQIRRGFSQTLSAKTVPKGNTALNLVALVKMALLSSRRMFWIAMQATSAPAGRLQRNRMKGRALCVVRARTARLVL
jgi:hypothetical protein